MLISYNQSTYGLTATNDDTYDQPWSNFFPPYPPAASSVQFASNFYAQHPGVPTLSDPQIFTPLVYAHVWNRVTMCNGLSNGSQPMALFRFHLEPAAPLHLHYFFPTLTCIDLLFRVRSTESEMVFRLLEMARNSKGSKLYFVLRLFWTRCRPGVACVASRFLGPTLTSFLVRDIPIRIDVTTC